MKKECDVVIIGSGIGGLIAGCYLAKEGLRVIIAEQHFKPGGYCTSFTRKGYKFDVGVHYLGAIRKGALGKILSELELMTDMKLNRVNPAYKIIMPDFVMHIWDEPDKTMEEFFRIFPKERSSIKNFFRFIQNPNFIETYKKIKNLTFGDVMDGFFSDYKIKSTLSVLLGNIGVSANDASALVAVLLFREYIFDAVYYPSGGMQEFPNILANKFKNLGGEICLSTRVKKILTSKNRVNGVCCDRGGKIEAKFVISDADATSIFTAILDTPTIESKLVNNLQVSPSIFMVYLGIILDSEYISTESNCIVNCRNYDMEKYFFPSKEDLMTGNIPLVSISIPSMNDRASICKNKHSMGILVFAPDASEKFWIKNKNLITNQVIGAANKIVDFSKGQIEVKEAGTPKTFYRYTSNYKGSAYGWAATYKQVKEKTFTNKSSIDGLFLAGHWSTSGGIPGVALSGRKTSEQILSELGMTWKYGLLKT